jgi:cellulose synthase/poly-beta-1,6-N-acetylglucosamine synthase-like glycosyltransferase
MISVITCCRHPLPQSIQEKNIARTIGVAYEYLPIDGSNHASNAALLNYGISLAKGDLIVFIADDAYSMKYNWGAALEQKFTDPHIACVGVAGTQYLFSNTPSLTAPGRPFIKGRIVYHLQNGDLFAVVNSQENGDFEVVACDGVFMAVRRPVLKHAWFDQDTFDGEHLFDIDLCMQLRKCGKIIITTDIVIKRRSQPVFDTVWHDYSTRFLEKWSVELPASCVSAVPDPHHIISSQCVDLRGKVPAETIC